MVDFEEEYLDVLQHIEIALLGVIREQARVLDYDVRAGVEALIREYQAESKRAMRRRLRGERQIFARRRMGA